MTWTASHDPYPHVVLNWAVVHYPTHYSPYPPTCFHLDGCGVPFKCKLDHYVIQVIQCQFKFVSIDSRDSKCGPIAICTILCIMYLMNALCNPNATIELVQPNALVFTAWLRAHRWMKRAADGEEAYHHWLLFALTLPLASAFAFSSLGFRGLLVRAFFGMYGVSMLATAPI